MLSSTPPHHKGRNIQGNIPRLVHYPCLSFLSLSTGVIMWLCKRSRAPGPGGQADCCGLSWCVFSSFSHLLARNLYPRTCDLDMLFHVVSDASHAGMRGRPVCFCTCHRSRCGHLRIVPYSIESLANVMQCSHADGSFTWYALLYTVWCLVWCDKGLGGSYICQENAYRVPAPVNHNYRKYC